MVLGLIGLGGIAGCGEGMNEGESVLATTPTLRIRVRLNQTTERTVRIPQGSTVLTAIKRSFSYQRRDDGLTVINGTAGHWQYAVNTIEPRIYAGNYRLNTNCRLDLRLL
jgi:hypothetical protein